ncbi:MAG: 30S ribosomal protein S16 [Sphaerochaetaceae bacterium]|nr:30S ribosomal protein S16 [Sphaerochaetaceae bacterium]
MVTIRLKRFGAKARPYFRVVVQDGRIATKGKTIDEIGTYNPIEAADKQINIDAEKANEWIKKGAVPSDTVKKIFNQKGIFLNRSAQN